VTIASEGGIGLETVVSALEIVMQNRRKRIAIPIAAETRLEDLDLDSLDVAELFITLEDELGCRLDPESVGEPERVGDLTRIARLR
jgi:acyl carrier protein